MSIAELMRSMMAAGATPEAIAIAIEAIEEVQRQAAQALAQLEERKEAERARKRRQRERTAEALASQDEDGKVTGHVTDVSGTVTGHVTGQNGQTPSPSLSPPQTPPNTHPHPHGEGNSRARKASPFATVPNGVHPDHWRDFCANRRTKRLTNSETAYRGVLKSLADLSDEEWPPGRLVEFAAAKGWGSINDPRDQANGHRNHGPLPIRNDTVRGQRGSPALELFRRGAAREAEEARAGEDRAADWGAWPALPADRRG